MDGYHIYRKDLSEEELKYRGNPNTFNKQQFKEDIVNLKNSH